VAVSVSGSADHDDGTVPLTIRLDADGTVRVRLTEARCGYQM
jgi:hypothetical protein